MTSERLGFVYGLVDPRTDEVRYVGKTIASPYGRYRSHVKDAEIGKIGHRSNWIRQLSHLDLRPRLLIIEQGVPVSTINDRERWWVQSGRSWGWDLTNATRGGEGAIRWSDDSRKNLSRAMKGKKRSPEAVALTAAAHRGMKRSESTCEKLSTSIRAAYAAKGPFTRSEETKRRMSEAAKRRWAREREEVK